MLIHLITIVAFSIEFSISIDYTFYIHNFFPFTSWIFVETSIISDGVLIRLQLQIMVF